jgi:hypothetical protein
MGSAPATVNVSRLTCLLPGGHSIWRAKIAHSLTVPGTAAVTKVPASWFFRNDRDGGTGHEVAGVLREYVVICSAQYFYLSGLRMARGLCF